MKHDLSPPVDHDTRLKRIRMRAWRRGMKEMDLLLGGFVDARAQELDDSQLGALEAVMTRPDQVLYDWVSGRTPDGPEGVTDAEKAIIDMVRAEAEKSVH